MQLGFHIKYMLPTMLDIEHSQLACPAASASKIREYGAFGLPGAAESSKCPWAENNRLLNDIIA